MKKAVNMSFPVKLFCGFLFSSAIPAIGISLLIHVQVTRFYKNELGNLYIEKLRVADTVLNMWEEETKKNALIISFNCGRLLGEYIQNREKNALDESKNKYDTVTSLMAASTILEDIVMVNSLYSSISLVYETSEYLINSNHGVRKNNNPETIKEYSAGIVEGKHWFVENDAGEGGHRLIYTFPVVSGFMRHKGIIIFEISEKELSGTINGNTDGSAAKIFIMDDKGTVISDADKSNLGKNLMPVHAVESVYGSPDSKGFFTSKIGGIEYFVIYWTSQLNNWYYCSLVPMTELNHRMNMISLMTAVLIIAFFILTVILSYSLAKRLNIPVQRMEYRLEDYKLIQSLLGKFDNQAVVSRPDIPEQAHPQKYFFNPYFCCVLLRTDRPDYLTKKPEENAAIGGGGGVIKLCIEALSEKVLCRGLVLGSNSIALVLNFHSLDTVFIKNVFKKVQEQTFEAFNLSLSIGIGTITPWVKISESYNAARKALLNRLMAGYGCLTVYEEEPKVSDYYFYPVEQENIIFNSLHLHLYDKTSAALDDFVERVKRQKDMSADNAILVFNQLMGSVIRYTVEARINTREIFDNEINLYYQFFESKTIDEIQSYFNELLKRIIDFELCADKTDSKKPIKKILNYIQNNLDKTFDINTMSDSIGLSYSHVRRVFSQEMGENILNYVYKMKIEAAKKLLAETHLSAEDIAKKIGFYNRQSFYRFFKKFEGMTPNEFRSFIDTR